ncbi:MAG: hypothetical protein AAF526_05195 [Pseudomonadota bacterium]
MIKRKPVSFEISEGTLAFVAKGGAVMAGTLRGAHSHLDPPLCADRPGRGDMDQP